ncbi:MAG: DoxX family membrane protein [Candidatus Binatia bacterium]
MTAADRKTDLVWNLLRGAFAVVPIAAGADKFFEKLADWDMYLSPAFEKLLPVAPDLAMRAAGVVEIAVGILMLTRFTRLAAYTASAWLALIALNLIVGGLFYDIAVRDLVLALAAFCLAQLTEARALRTASAGGAAV